MLSFTPLSAHSTLSPNEEYLHSLSTKHSIDHCPDSSPYQHITQSPKAIILRSLNTPLYGPLLSFSPTSPHYTIDHRTISPLSQHTTVSLTAQYLPSVRIQHCIAHRSVFPLHQHSTLHRPPHKFFPLSTHRCIAHCSVSPSIST